MKRLVLFVLLALGLGLPQSILAYAQDEPPTQAGATPSVGRAQQEFYDWPYRLILSGPATAHAGSDVAYVVTYQQVNQASGSHFVFAWPPEAASLASYRVVSGPEGTTRDQNPGRSVSWDFGPSASEGAVEFVLHVDHGFTGDLRVSIYVKGTSIRLPEDSVTEVTTFVTAPAELPETGGGSDHIGSGGSTSVAWLGAALALAGAALVSSAAACQRRFSR